MKEKLFLIILFINFIDTFAQIDIIEKIVVDNSYITLSTSLTASADFDNDGDSDIVASGSDLNWYENLDGLGGFGMKNLIATRTNARVIQSADFDNDGDIDIIILGDRNQIHIYENKDGKGTFELNQNLGSNSNSTILLSDIDKDGDLDILSSITSSSPSKTRIVFYENADGKGDYSTAQTIISLDNSRFIKELYIADIDNDNDLDIISAFYNDDTVSWFEHLDGNGNFSSEVVVTNAVEGVISIAATDIDKDGDIDIISASEKDNKIAWYENTDGEGNFSDQQIISSNMINVQSIHIADIDNDGDIDVLSAASTPTSAFQGSIDNKIAWFENTDGKGYFGQEQVISTKAIGAKGVITDDVNGDGYIDVISVSKDDNKVAWYKNTNTLNRFDDARVITRQVRFASRVYAGDFDGDLDIDILSLSQHDAEVAWYENMDGRGFFGNQRIITERISTGNSTPTAFPVDLDGDGDLDIPVGFNNELSWYENVDGKGNFRVKHIITTETGHPDITRASDLDGDGDMDLVYGYGSNRVVWYENTDGKGSFSSQQIIIDPGAGSGSVASMEISDMDGDGDDDIIFVSFNSSSIKWYENVDGKGAFTTNSFRANENGAVYPADIDGDGDMDILALSKNSSHNNSVSWYENTDGKGSFNIEHQVSNVRILGKSISAADLDNDGDLDVITASGHPNTSGKLAWYENIDGNGNFSDQQIISEVDKPIVGEYVYAADIDGDNDMDVVSAFGYAPFGNHGKVAWYENRANETLSINDIIASSSFIYPNPTKGILKIDTITTPKKIEIFNILGRKILSFYNKNEIDITNLSNGLYLISVLNKNSDHAITLKIIKE